MAIAKTTLTYNHWLGMGGVIGDFAVGFLHSCREVIAHPQSERLACNSNKAKVHALPNAVVAPGLGKHILFSYPRTLQAANHAGD